MINRHESFSARLFLFSILSTFLLFGLSACSALEQDNLMNKEQTRTCILTPNYTKSLSHTNAKKTQSGDVKILDTKVVIEGNVVSSLFEIETTSEGEYFLSVFMIPEDSSVYSVWFNGEKSEGELKPMKTGWQSILLTDENGEAVQIPLKQGKNELSFHSSSNDFPEIQIVRMTTSKDDVFISTKAYDQYFKKLLSLEHKTKSQVRLLSSFAPNSFFSQYLYELNCPLLYSFTKTIVLTAPYNTVTISSFGVDSPIVIEVFKDYVFSWKQVLTAPGSVSEGFPPGTYTVHFHRYLQNAPTIAPINISYTGNINHSYQTCPISGFNYETQPYFSPGGIVNYFTCYASEGTDPVMYLENAYAGAVGSVNDDYIGTGDYQWGVNARITTSYSGSPLVHIFNASAILPEGFCDLYIKIPFQSITDYLGNSGELYSWSYYFPSIKQDDILLSGNSSDIYNCFAWAGDLTGTVVNPLSPASPYYVEDTSPIGLFDLYFASRGYSRTYYEQYAGVVLWVKDDIITHASIRKNARTIYPHGYDWESKIGPGPRIFHEKNSLAGDNFSNTYGEITYYYEHNPLLTVSSYQCEQPSVSPESRKYLAKRKSQIVTKNIEEAFHLLYNKWEQYCLSPAIAVHSNPVFWKNNDTYRDLKSFCLSNQDASILLVAEHLLQEEIRAGYLLDDIFPEALQELKLTAYHRYKEGQKILPTTMGNFFRLAEAYLIHAEETRHIL